MAKKKSEKPKTGNKNIFVLWGTDEFKEWMDGLAKHLGLPVAIVVQESLKEKAERVGYKQAPGRY